LVTQPLELFSFYSSVPYSIINTSAYATSSSASDRTDEGKDDTVAKRVKAALNEKIRNQYIVVLKEDSLQSGAKATAEDVEAGGAKVLRKYEKSLKGFAVLATERSLERIRNNPSVSYIEEDRVVGIFGQKLPKGINRVDADLSSTKSGNHAGKVNVDIAIIDTGIQTNHQDLYVYKHVSFVPGVTSGNDDHGHGTHVAGIAAAKDNYNGVVGVAPGARLWAIKVLDKYGYGSLSDIIAGIDYVTKNADQIEVANISFGCECVSNALDEAIRNSVQAGVTFVVAAGNSGKDASFFSPANHPDVITVSAIVDTDGKCGGKSWTTTFGKDDSFASFSNFGEVVDIAAPGVKIYSTYKGKSYATMSGTSMAAPHVAGAAALYMSLHPDVFPIDVKNALISTGSTKSTGCDGNGRGYFTGDPDVFAEPVLYVRPF
jgi:subtilisin family serine protease